MSKLLIADDNRQINAILKEYAKKEGYEVIECFDGQDALEKFEIEKPDIILLDVMMPKIDGFSVCREIRYKSNVPIIMVTAKGEDYEKIMGLDIGADDYIVKPFSPGEVMARVRAIMRRITRKEDSQQKVIDIENLHISLDDYKVLIDNEEVLLTKKEIEILWTLCREKNKVFSREKLLNDLWGYDYYGDTRTVDTHIKRLRAKLEKYDHQSWEIKTIWGVGYSFSIL